MKTLLISVVVLFFVGCTPGITFVPRTLSFGAFDFRPYTEKGFLMTPKSYSGEYMSVGIVSLALSPEAKLMKVKIQKKDTVLYRSEWKCEELKAKEVLDSLYFYCKLMGADALVDFQISESEEIYNIGTNKPVVTIRGLRASGFAIRRIVPRVKVELEKQVPQQIEEKIINEESF